MVKKLTKHGSSFSIVLSKALLKSLHIDENTKLIIESDGKQIIIKPASVVTKQPVKKVAMKEKFPRISNKASVQKVFEKLATKHKAALKKLANN